MTYILNHNYKKEGIYEIFNMLLEYDESKISYEIIKAKDKENVVDDIYCDFGYDAFNFVRDNEINVFFYKRGKEHHTTLSDFYTLNKIKQGKDYSEKFVDDLILFFELNSLMKDFFKEMDITSPITILTSDIINIEDHENFVVLTNNGYTAYDLAKIKNLKQRDNNFTSTLSDIFIYNPEDLDYILKKLDKDLLTEKNTSNIFKEFKKFTYKNMYQKNDFNKFYVDTYTDLLSQYKNNSYHRIVQDLSNISIAKPDIAKLLQKAPSIIGANLNVFDITNKIPQEVIPSLLEAKPLEFVRTINICYQNYEGQEI